jgi:hypothetical protein
MKENKQTPKQRQVRFDIRKKAKTAIKNLTDSMNMIKTLDNPERDYAEIFREDKPYFKMLEACRSAYSMSFKSTNQLRRVDPEEFLIAIQHSWISYTNPEIISEKTMPSAKQLSNRRFRNKILEQIEKDPVEYPRFLHLCRQRIFGKHQKMMEELVRKEQVIDANSTLGTLYAEEMREKEALQIATHVYEKLVQGDPNFLNQPLEQIRKEFLEEKERFGVEDSKRELQALKNKQKKES